MATYQLANELCCPQCQDHKLFGSVHEHQEASSALLLKKMKLSQLFGLKKAKNYFDVIITCNT